MVPRSIESDHTKNIRHMRSSGTRYIRRALFIGATPEGNDMRKHSILFAAAALLLSTGLASAQNNQPPASQQRPQQPATSGQSDPARGTGMTGAPSSTNPQAGGGAAGHQTPREVPEQGGAPNTQVPMPRR
jgi:hypothetical protein